MSAKRMVRHAGIGLVFALALAAVTGGCRNTEKNAVDDALIAARVRHELTETSELARFPIVVDAMAGKVTLEVVSIDLNNGKPPRCLPERWKG